MRAVLCVVGHLTASVASVYGDSAVSRRCCRPTGRSQQPTPTSLPPPLRTTAVVNKVEITDPEQLREEHSKNGVSDLKSLKSPYITIYFSRFIHVVARIRTSFPFTAKPFHHMTRRPFVSPFIHRRTFGSFPLFGYRDQRCSEHAWTSFCFNACFQFFWTHTWGAGRGIAGLHGNSTKSNQFLVWKSAVVSYFADYYKIHQ